MGLEEAAANRVVSYFCSLSELATQGRTEGARTPSLDVSELTPSLAKRVSKVTNESCGLGFDRISTAASPTAPREAAPGLNELRAYRIRCQGCAV